MIHCDYWVSRSHKNLFKVVCACLLINFKICIWNAYSFTEQLVTLYNNTFVSQKSDFHNSGHTTLQLRLECVIFGTQWFMQKHWLVSQLFQYSDFVTLINKWKKNVSYHNNFILVWGFFLWVLPMWLFCV